jgi:hypothetical protein
LDTLKVKVAVPPATGADGEIDFVIERSADGVTAVLVVATLLLSLGSGVVESTEAVFTMGETAEVATVELRVIVALALGAKVPRLQARVPVAMLQLPTEVTADDPISSAGSGSVTVTPPAGAGPALVAVRV